MTPRHDLHIAISQRIVGKHRNNRRISLATTRDEIQRCAEVAGTAMESADLARMREQLEKATGINITELAHIAAKRWPR